MGGKTVWPKTKLFTKNIKLLKPRESSVRKIVVKILEQNEMHISNKDSKFV